MFCCESRTRSGNSNFPLKQVDNPCWRYTPRALFCGCSPKYVYSYGQQPETRNPPLASTSLLFDSPRQSLLKIQIPTPAILRLHSQSISGRHLADALATTLTLNLCHFSKSPPKSIYHCPPSSHNVKNPKPMSKSETGNTHTDRRLARTQTTYQVSVT